MKNRRLKNLIQISVFLLCSLSPVLSVSQKVNVAITQIVPHPSLDLIRKGIEDELVAQRIPCNVQFENAQGNIAIAAQIAQQFASQRPAIIVPITTPSAQAVYAATFGQGIPIVFAAVSDPVTAKLVPSMNEAGLGITGVSDLSPIDDQVDLIQEIFPHIQKVGVVYNAGEGNSVALVKLFEKALTDRGITLCKATAANMVDVSTATYSLIGKVEAIYIPNDNTVIAALEGLLKIAQQNNIPVFCADPESVKQGCLASLSHSQYGLGRQTGVMVAKILQGENIQNLPVERPKDIELSLNVLTAQNLKLTLSKTLLERAQHIIQKSEKLS